jgi:rubredoxin
VERLGATLRCPNCGEPIPPDAKVETSSNGPAGYRCPVCQLQFTPAEPEPTGQLASAEDLETRLSSLVSLARASGLTADEIVQALRDELAFTAEMAHRGRQVFVQIIDLGPQVGVAPDPTAPEGRELLLSRGHPADRLR